MTHLSLLALSPILVVSATCLIVMLGIAMKRDHALMAGVSLGGLALALIATAAAWLCAAAPQAITALLIIDRFACFYLALILIAALAVTALSYVYLRRYQGHREEMYLLLLLSTLGGMVMVTSCHFSSFFVGLELLSMPMYGMAAYLVKERRSLEAGMKYLVLSAVASAFILFGMALIYAQTGTMVFGDIGMQLAQLSDGQGIVILGAALLLIGLGFKLSLAPFHLWTPDVYQGAPAPVAAFLATASKVPVLALLLRYVLDTHAIQYAPLVEVLSLLAILSIIAGNVLALQQWNLKRLLAYSAIAHFGYMLVALIASGPLATEAVSMYLLTYSIPTLAAFGVITLVSNPLDHEAEALTDYRGLFWTHPGLAAILTLALLSLAGVPLTAGFLGKFYVLGAGVDQHQWLLLGALVAGSAVGLFFYLRAMIQLYLSPTPEVAATAVAPAPSVVTAGAGAGVLIVLLVLMLILGVYPSPFVRLAQGAVSAPQGMLPITASRR
ncbi:MAG TPA: NADH-quinone oxidoreductase subunit NuoN [Steroidobacteraceae bacterium]|jgi:NADH-quinone oxidoreductase subunit N|nr:NADH-quinone oxidoreductase subunit NuoN [Steroidobacteraceae bacterium]